MFTVFLHSTTLTPFMFINRDEKQKNQWKILLRTKFNHNIFNCAINHSRGKLQSEKRELKYFSIHFMMVRIQEREREREKRKMKEEKNKHQEKITHPCYVGSERPWKETFFARSQARETKKSKEYKTFKTKVSWVVGHAHELWNTSLAGWRFCRIYEIGKGTEI